MCADGDAVTGLSTIASIDPNPVPSSSDGFSAASL